MSDPKEFLSRWSQRKLNPEAEKPAPTEKTALPAGEDAAAQPAPDLEFDITTLPSLESIGANSDITAFLQRGVPAGLTRAALRRAWSADPAIRDFVGLSENSWDFNAPDSMPGFGSLSPDEVRQAAARLFGGLTEETTGQAPAADARESDESSAEITQTAGSDSEPDTSSAPDPQLSSDDAVQHDEEDESDHSPAPQRRHGGALPK